jgi:hypothetical protein
VAWSRQHLGFPSFLTNVLPDRGRAAPHGAPLIAARYGAQIYVSETTLTYLQCVKPRTPSLAKLARTWPLLFGQPFDAKAALGFIRATSSAGFETQRGFLWHGPQRGHYRARNRAIRARHCRRFRSWEDRFLGAAYPVQSSVTSIVLLTTMVSRLPAPAAVPVRFVRVMVLGLRTSVTLHWSSGALPILVIVTV